MDQSVFSYVQYTYFSWDYMIDYFIGGDTYDRSRTTSISRGIISKVF